MLRRHEVSMHSPTLIKRFNRAVPGDVAVTVYLLPVHFPSSMRYTFAHGYVNIHNEGPIPESLSKLHCLEELWLNGNRLSGSIPDGLASLSHLRQLYLNANELVGDIPSSFSELTNLEGLNVGWNDLSGGFPPCLGNMVRFCLCAVTTVQTMDACSSL